MTFRRSVHELGVRVTRRVPFARHAFDLLPVRLRSAASVTRGNTLEAYESVYGSNRLLNAYLSQERLDFYGDLATIFAPMEPRRVIDVGCGTGHLLRFLVDRMTTPPERMVGVDHSEAGIRRARELLPQATWFVGDIYDRSLGGEQFDLVLCTEVLEHLHEPVRATAVLCELCAPGGRIAITVPDGAQDSWEGHVNFWDEEGLRSFLEPSGLVGIDRIGDDNTFLAWLAPSG